MVLTQQEKDYLKTAYYDISKVGSFRGPTALYNLVQSEGKHQISLNDIKKWLRGESTYTRWKPARVNYPRNSIEALYVGHLMQFDLADFHKDKEIHKETGKLMKYLLVCIDSFSRYAMCVPLEDRKSSNVIQGLKAVFDTGYVPRTALGDPAGEHISAQTKKFFKRMGIHLYFTTSKIHAPQAERFIRTLRTALRRYRTANNTNKWLYASMEIVKNYNLTRSRTHGQKPADVFKSEKIAWAAYKKLYGQKKKPKSVKKKVVKHIKKKKKLPKVGDYVRLSRLKHPFEKESTELGTFTREIFKIIGVDLTKEVPMFKLEDLKEKPVKGKAYLEEIQVIDYDPNQYFEVEKVLRRRKRGNVNEVLVKWRGYNNRFISWIKESEVENLYSDIPVVHVH